MYTFKASETTNLSAGVCTVKNTSNKPATLLVYVPNKDSIPVTVEANATVKITTLSAGETFAYLSQANSALTVTYAAS